MVQTLAVRPHEALPSVEKARALLAECRSTHEVKKIHALAQAVATAARGTEIGLDASEIVLWAKRRIGELSIALPKAPSGNARVSPESGVRTQAKQDALAVYGLTKQRVSEAEKIAVMPEADLRQYMAASRKHGEAPTLLGAVSLARISDSERRLVIAKLGDVPQVSRAIQEARRELAIEKLNSTAAKEAKRIEGVYDVIVIDPPWPMEKIERDVRPNQIEFDYPTMSEDELRVLKVPCTHDAHVWLWTTHRFLPMAFRLLEAWALKYVCTFVWHKPGGYQPVGLPQYNCEFAIYARRGAPKFVSTKSLNVCFEAPRGKHSEKPEVFYELVRRVTAGRRLDMFNRRRIEGFDRWGKEAG